MHHLKTLLPYCPLATLLGLVISIVGALGWFHQSLATPTLAYAGLGITGLSLLVWLVGVLTPSPRSIKRSTLGVALALMALLMFGFSYALIPFYDVLCNQLDINGKVHALPLNKPQVQRHRTTLPASGMMLNTLITAHGGIPVNISERALHQPLTPGKSVKTQFVLTNLSDRTLHLRVKLSLSPSKAGHFLLGQTPLNQTILTLKPYGKKPVSASFFLKEDAPTDMHHVALGIGLFNASDKD